ncbi:MAG: putative ABC transporter permease [Evtepia sp.]|uniref:putative ABC transporter permease n=1 Tax=Evtepia sp. TaxID=2773933 RepID=UPI002A76452E|nr:putative ABC transporter permease [Evtepia sp.]MDY3014691.1 putative ABC transporter permease [Evtepia sp.]
MSASAATPTRAKTPLKHLFLFFVFYSVFGWCYEVFLETVVYRWGFSNRGVLFGPYCPVYGVGALLFLLLFYRLIKGKPLKTKLLMLPVVFLGCMISATLLELAASYLCESIMGSWPWQTYADYKYNFQARIALSPSIRFGLGGLFFLYILQPLLEKGVRALSDRTTTILTTVLAVVGGVDLIHFILKTAGVL